MDNQKTNNTTKISIIIVIIIIALGFLFYVDYKQNKGALVTVSDLINKEDSPEIKDLKKDNENAINDAQKEALLSVRGIDETDHVIGDIGAPVQIITYSDFECPFCAGFSDTVKKIEDYFKDNIVIAFRHYPLRSHSSALGAALASECAAEQGKFWEMHDILFSLNKAGDLGVEQYKKGAQELGLNLVQFNQCLDTQKYKDKIQAQWLEGVSAGITGTPGNFINGIPAPGAVPFEDYKDNRGETQPGMKSLIERKLENF